MSDFFTRLAEKALGVAPLVRPVIAPFFSPDPGVSGAFIEAMEQVDADLPGKDAPGLGADAFIQPLQAAAPDLPGAEDLRGQPPTPPAATEPSTSIRTQAATSSRSLLPTLKPEGAPSVLEQRQSAGGQPTIPRVTETDRTLQASDTPSAPAGSDRPVILVPLPRRGGQKDDSASIDLETDAEFQLSPDLQAHELPKPQTLIRPAKPPTRRQRVSSSSQSNKLLEAQEEAGLKTDPTTTGNEAEMPGEPTIHVTIGRVEVRLVQPPATKPPPARTATPPALSLDEYLKKRSEGRQ
jgi:hypothetical protein